MRQLTILLMAVGVGLGSATAQTLKPATESYSGLQLVAPDEVPFTGTFWHAVGANGKQFPPFPCPPEDPETPIYSLGNGQFLVDDRQEDIPLMLPSFAPAWGDYAMGSTEALPPGPGEGPFGDPPPPPQPDPRRNYEKFAAHTFLLLDTNSVAYTDTNRYAACVSFPSITNTSPVLQIARYQTNALIIRASHFDYSAETNDFALLISDRPDAPLWKNVDLSGSSDTQDG